MSKASLFFALMVRRSAVATAAALKSTVPALLDSLQWVAANDPEPKLRDLAASYL